jgi:hypothetical protein
MLRKARGRILNPLIFRITKWLRKLIVALAHGGENTKSCVGFVFKTTLE